MSKRFGSRQDFPAAILLLPVRQQCLPHLLDCGYVAAALTFPALKRRKRHPDRAPASTGDRASKASGNSPPSAAASSFVRRWVFPLVALMLPLVLVGILELVLRLSGYGHPASFFVERQLQSVKVLVENPSFGLSFFPPALLRGASPVVMQAVKPRGTCRIFLFGESAALGDPRPAYGFGRYLETLMRERFPGRRFEVVCVAVTAINSHAIRQIAAECARHQGDLWVVYMGNNEFTGPFGATAVFGAKAPPGVLVRMYLAAQRTRIGQGIVTLARQIRTGKAPGNWGGMKMFLDQQLAPDDPRKERVYENFQDNLTSIIKTGTAAGVPVILCSVASNLKDCPPLGSLPPPELVHETLTEWNSFLQAGATNQAQQQLGLALTNYQQAARISFPQPRASISPGAMFPAHDQQRAGAPLFCARSRP